MRHVPAGVERVSEGPACPGCIVGRVPYTTGSLNAGPAVRRVPDGRGRRGMAQMNDELLAILQCPVAHAPVVRSGDWIYSTHPKTRRKYPIQDGIPILLIASSSG